MANIKRALNIAMAERDMKIRQLSRLCGVTAPVLYQTFYYRQNPTFKTLDKVAKALDLTVSEFVKLGE